MASALCVVSVPLTRERNRPPDVERCDVERAAAGDTEAFERLYRRHVGQVWSLARRLLGVALADDMTQEVFLLAWRKLDQYRGAGPFGAWLMALARNLMVTRVTRSPEKTVQLEAVMASGGPAGRAPDPAQALELDAALERLPSRARHVLVLRHFAGCSHEEIARLLSIHVGTSKSQLHRARTLLRRELEATPHDD